MSYAILGFGKIGQALAQAFARNNVDVTVASRRPPEALAPQARAIGPTVVAKSLENAVEADTIILAIPFSEHREVAKRRSAAVTSPWPPRGRGRRIRGVQQSGRGEPTSSVGYLRSASPALVQDR
jgi:glycerol-3-phosphate dehydrogenase